MRDIVTRWEIYLRDAARRCARCTRVALGGRGGTGAEGRSVSEVITSGVRRIDTAARYGGDEFVVLLPETDPTGAFVLAEKIRVGVVDMPLELPSPTLRPSLSVGVVSYPDDGTTADELMISADGAMYASKRAGKNRVTGVRMPTARAPRDGGVPSTP